MNKKTEYETFPAASRGRGYDREQVEEFLGRARAAYDSGAVGEVTSEEVRDVAFTLRKNGYDPKAVDLALDRLEDVFKQRELSAASGGIGGEDDDMRKLAGEVFLRGRRAAGKRFRRRSLFATGYKRREVDVFVDRALNALSGQGSLTVQQVRETSFGAQLRGYDEAQVDAYLDAIVSLAQISDRR
ncbi:MAG: DivIVA domain-containing protein [Microbacteriaceae bacterium]|nr:DivIVA domain-containing protein [Microbacteriaceae bacterium]